MEIARIRYRAQAGRVTVLLSRNVEMQKALIACPTISRTPSAAMIEHVAGLLGAAGTVA
jgi:hypothetical protein